jgi:hypothetical protein
MTPTTEHETTSHGAGRAFPMTGIPAQRRHEEAEAPGGLWSGALVEQAKGMLVHRYGIAPQDAGRLLDLWAQEANVEARTVAATLIEDIAQSASHPARDPALVEWLTERLQGDCPELDLVTGVRGAPVTVEVDLSFSTVEAVVEAAREASRRGVPLELTTSAADAAGGPEHSRAHLMQQLDLAIELARAVEPGLVVRLPVAG